MISTNLHLWIESAIGLAPETQGRLLLSLAILALIWLCRRLTLLLVWATHGGRAGTLPLEEDLGLQRLSDRPGGSGLDLAEGIHCPSDLSRAALGRP